MNKVSILENLKREVLQLKGQLNCLENYKTTTSPCNIKHSSHSKSITSRFRTSNFDSNMMPEKGLRHFKTDHSKNLSQLIENKSSVQKVPKMSAYRKAEIARTKENFNTKFQSVSPRNYNPKNPLTGQGYKVKKQGIRIVHQQPRSSFSTARGQCKMNNC